MSSVPIKVLLVDDSKLALSILSRLIAQDPDIQVVGQAQNGLEALKLIPLVHPTIICTDYYMPEMNGLELTKKVMHMYPMPILVLSSILDVKSSKEVFYLIQAGALDCIQKPTNQINDALSKALIDKIRLLSGVYTRGTMSLQTPSYSSQSPKIYTASSCQIIALGSSTGGPTALATIFNALPKNFPIPIVCVQHISKGFLEGFAEWLRTQCPLNVKIVKGEEQMQAGYIYLPAEGTHLIVDKDNSLRASFAPPIDNQRPSIDVTMETAALHYKNASIGILLTGMGKDGARGLKAIFHEGGLTIAQSEESCVVFGMPQEAINMGAASFIMDPSAIAKFLKEKFCA